MDGWMDVSDWSREKEKRKEKKKGWMDGWGDEKVDASLRP
jgi:hypothetical protein